MFYGYDLGIDMVSSTAMPTTTMPTMTTAPETTNVTTSTDNTTKVDETTTSTVKIETTTTPITTITTTTSTIPTTEITEVIETTTTEIITTTSEETTIKPEEPTEMNAPEETTTETATKAEETTTEATKPEPETDEAAELISTFVAEPNSEAFLRIEKARVTRLPSAKLQAPLSPKTKPQANYLPAQRKARRLTSRNKRHLFGFKDFDANLFVTLFNAETQFQSPLTTGTALGGLPTYVQISHDYEVASDPNFIATSQPSSNLKQNYNTDVISHVFYLNNQHVIYTTFKVYNAVLYYKYFEHLRLSVLELELDTMEYNLMILLPDYNTDLVTAAQSLRSGPKLRVMRKQLKPKWVQAIIPDFRLHGTMFLTNDLQNVSVL